MSELTVVIATRNRGVLLDASIRSILAQDVDLQVKVVRTQGDEEVPSVAAVSDTRVEVLESQSTRRAFRAWQIGIERTTSPWMMTFDDDDLMVPGMLKAMMDLAKARDFDLLGGQMVIIESQDSIAELSDLRPPRRIRSKPFSWVRANPFDRYPIPGITIYRTEVVRGFAFDSVPPVGTDVLFALWALDRAHNPGTCNIPIRAYRIHSGQASQTQDEFDPVAVHFSLLESVRDQYPQIARYMGRVEILNQATSDLRIGKPYRVILRGAHIAAVCPSALARRQWWRLMAHVVLGRS